MGVLCILWVHKDSEPHDEGEPLTMSDENKVEKSEAGQEIPKWEPPKVYKLKHLILVGVVALIIGAIISTVTTEPEVVTKTLRGKTVTKVVSDPADEARISELALELDDTKKELGAAQGKLATFEGEAAKVAEAEQVAKAKVAETTFRDGTYLVGTDMPAGRYKGTTDSGKNGYWAIHNDANGSDTIENDLTKGPFYVSVKDGQYVEFNRVSVTKIE